MIKTYYLLTKPGILAGNLITTSGAFFLASHGDVDYRLFCWTILGLFGVIASACVLNNCIDQEADGKMERTKHRPLVTKRISTKQALLFAFLLVLGGFWTLWQQTNIWAFSAAVAGFLIYSGFYSFWKYYHATAIFIGSIAGAMPPVVGYCAASGRMDGGAWILFSLLVFWQMPHFFAISIYRMKEYAAASIPVFPTMQGALATKIHMLGYTIAFLGISILPTIYGLTGKMYLCMAIALASYWVWLSFRGFKAINDQLWARRMFAHSLVIIMLFSFMFSVDAYI